MGKYWNTEKEVVFKEWIKNPNNVLLTQIIGIELKSIANFMAYNKARNWWLYSATREDLIGELVTEAAKRLLDYDESKGGKVYSIIYTAMLYHIIHKYSFVVRQKRNCIGKLLSLNADDDEFNIKETRANNEHYDIYKDSQFIQFLCDWWKSFDFEKASNRHKRRFVMLIINILEHPELHPSVKTNYTRYICQRLHVSRERMRQIYQWMRKYSYQIRHEYEYGNFVRKII